MLRPFEKYLRSRPGDPGDQAGQDRWKQGAEYASLQKIFDAHPEAADVVDSGAVGTYFERKQRDPSVTFADASFVYYRDFSPESAFNGDGFQFGFDTDSVRDRAVKTHDLTYPQGTLPANVQAIPDTDYEFSAYACREGTSELLCMLSPGMPRVHMFPRTLRGKNYPHAVAEAATRVDYANGRAIYKIALPWKSIGIDRPVAGTDFGFTFRFNSAKGDQTEFGADLAATKSNGLTLHPYWSPSPSCTVRWKLLP